MNTRTHCPAWFLLAAIAVAPVATARQSTPPAQTPPAHTPPAAPPAPAPTPDDQDDLTNPLTGHAPTTPPTTPPANPATPPTANPPAKVPGANPQRETAAAPGVALDTSSWKLVQSGPVSFKAPPGWEVEMPAKSMFTPLAQFKLVGEQGKLGAQLKVFGGIGGGVAPNIQRWISQVSAPIAPAKTTDLTVNGLKVAQVEVTGSFNTAPMAMQPGQPAQMQADTTLLGAIVETSNGDIQFKLVGGKDVIARNRPEWDAMIQSIAPAR